MPTAEMARAEMARAEMARAEMARAEMARAETVAFLRPPAAPRWRLAVTGRAGDAAIDAELASDSTDAGRRKAATASASIPDAAHKAAAWHQVAESTELGLEESVMVHGRSTRQNTLTCSRRTRRSTSSSCHPSGPRVPICCV